MNNTGLDTGLDTSLGGTSPQTGPQQTIVDQLGTDLVFSSGLLVAADADYQLVAGINNLKAAIYRRLFTPKGSFKPFPDYGCGVGQYVKRKLTRTVLDALRHDIVANLSQDPRIAKVEDVTLTPFTDNYGGQALQVNVAVTALGKIIRFSPFTFTEK